MGGMYTHFFLHNICLPCGFTKFIIILYKEKSGKGLLKYILTGVIGGISAILLFPDIYTENKWKRRKF